MALGRYCVAYSQALQNFPNASQNDKINMPIL